MELLVEAIGLLEEVEDVLATDTLPLLNPPRIPLVGYVGSTTTSWAGRMTPMTRTIARRRKTTMTSTTIWRNLEPFSRSLSLSR